MIKDYKNKITLSKINSWAIIYNSGRRGKQTFKCIGDYPFEQYKKIRKDDAIVELAVDYGVKDITKYTIKVEEWSQGKKPRIVWKK